MTATLMVDRAGSRGGGTGHRGAGGAATVAVLAVVSVAVLCWRGKAHLEYLWTSCGIHVDCFLGFMFEWERICLRHPRTNILGPASHGLGCQSQKLSIACCNTTVSDSFMQMHSHSSTAAMRGWPGLLSNEF